MKTDQLVVLGQLRKIPSEFEKLIEPFLGYFGLFFSFIELYFNTIIIKGLVKPTLVNFLVIGPAIENQVEQGTIE